MRLYTNSIALKGVLSLFLAAVILSAGVSCRNDKSLESKVELEGYWILKVNEDGFTDRYIFRYKKMDDGSYTGFSHSFRDEYSFGRLIIKDIKFDPPNFSALTNEEANIRYSGTIEPGSEKITGKLTYSDGNSREFNLTKAKKEDLTGIFPRGSGEKVIYQYTIPEYIDKGWDTASPEEVGINTQMIENAVNGIINEDYGIVQSLVVIKNNKLICDEYFYGFDRTIPHHQASVTKSVSSLVTGIAVDQGKIQSIDRNIFEYFPDYSNKKIKVWENVTLKNFLTMTVGLDWTQELEQKFEMDKDKFDSVLSRKPVTKPGTKFEYRNPNIDLFAGVIENSTGIKLDKYAEQYLFKPLNIKDYKWHYFNGFDQPRCDGSLMLRPRDMAKLGSLLLNKGRWKGKQIVSEKWIDDSMRSHIRVDQEFTYGYLWWIKDMTINGKNVKIVFANGWGSQFIMAIPSLDMIVVMTGNNESNEKHFAPFDLVDKYLIKPIT